MGSQRISHRFLLTSVLPLQHLSPADRRIVDEAIRSGTGVFVERATRRAVAALAKQGILLAVADPDPTPANVECFINRETGDRIRIQWSPADRAPEIRVPIPTPTEASRISLAQARQIMGLDAKLFTPAGHLLFSYADIIRIALGTVTEITGADYATFIPTKRPNDSPSNLEDSAEAPRHLELIAPIASPGEQVVVYFPDVRTVPALRGIAPGEDFLSAAIVRVGEAAPPALLQGILEAWSRSADALTEEGLQTLGLFAQQLGATFRKVEVLEKLVFYDSLTGLYNRHFFNVQIEKEIERARRERRSFGLAIIDLDNFKLVNTRFGYQGGNDLLVQVSELLKASIRPFDIVARWGGEEFALILSGPVGEREVLSVCNRLREIAGAHPYTVTGLDLASHRVTLGLSVGVALYPADAQTAKGLWAASNTALQVAKERGKNQVVGYGHLRRDDGRDLET